MEPIEIPHYVDDPPHVLLWSAEELAPVAMGMAIGMVAGQAMLLTVLGLAVAKIYRRFSDGRPDGFILHWLYWHGFIPCNARTTPNPYSRRFMP
jgi:conjugal transfer pilus assembly protein TraL